MGAAPVYGAVGELFEDGRVDELPISMRTAELRLFAPEVARELRELKPGATILADPRSRDGYMSMAVAPVYVVSSVPRHTAFTPENRVQQRFRTAVSFFDGAFDAPGKLTAEDRLQLLLDEQVDAVVMNPRANRFVVDLLRDTPGVTVAARGANQMIFLIDRRAVAKAQR